MSKAIRWAALALLLAAAPEEVLAADVVVLQCFFYDGDGGELTARTRSDGMGPFVLRARCSQLIADLLEDGYELSGVHNGDLELPIYTLIRRTREDQRRAGVAERSASTDVLLLDCFQYLGVGLQGFLVASSSSSAGPPPRAMSSCAAELASALGDGFRLVGVQGGTRIASVHYVLVRGPGREFAEGARHEPIDAAQLSCRAKDLELAVFAASTSRAAPPIASGAGTSCASELAMLFREGFEMASVQVGASDDATYALVRERSTP